MTTLHKTLGSLQFHKASWELKSINRAFIIGQAHYEKTNYTVYVLNFQTLLLFLFSNEMLVLRAGSHKMLVRIVNRLDPDQTASSEAV